MLWPCAPCGWPQPRITSSTSFGSRRGALPSTSLIACAARSSGRVMLKLPRWDFASGVRELATMTASLMMAGPFFQLTATGRQEPRAVVLVSLSRGAVVDQPDAAFTDQRGGDARDADQGEDDR